jgi:hypothetical protein
MPECYELLDYYFDVAENPSWKYFANYADNIVYKRKQVQQDNKDRAERRLKAKEWLNE